MRADHAGNAPDPDEFEDDEALGLVDDDTPEPSASAGDSEPGADAGAEPGADPALAAESDAGFDEDLLDAELGGFDGPVIVEDIDEELLDQIDPDDLEDDDDDREIVFLQEMGIDLDAPDDLAAVDVSLRLDDDEAVDDEVAA